MLKINEILFHCDFKTPVPLKSNFQHGKKYRKYSIISILTTEDKFTNISESAVIKASAINRFYRSVTARPTIS